MFQHYIKLAYRNSIRDKSTFLINLIGLSTGLACTLLIALWVQDELNVDGFHTEEARLYQAMTNHNNSNEVLTHEGTQGLLADALKADFPEVDIAIQASVDIPQPFILSVGDQKIKPYGKCADADYFKLFSFEVVQGDETTFLKDKQSIVLSEKLANKFFPNGDAIGQTINWEIIQFNGVATVTGVFKMPPNTSEKFDFLLPFDVYRDMRGDGIHWGNFNALTYVLLNENSDVAEMNKRLPAYIQEKAEWDGFTTFLTPYSDRYLYSKFENGKQAGGRIDYVHLFSIIAFFILLIACINFMNLSTAKSTKRLKEVGVRKTVGANRQSLIAQYLLESTFIAFIALVVALGLVYATLSPFNLLTGKELNLVLNGKIIAGLLGVTLLTGLIAGSYPAFYLSSFQPVKTLKGKVSGTISAEWIRKTLVVSQFALSIILIVAVLITYQQIQFIQNKNLGYNKENIITFPKEGMANNQLETFVQQLKNIPGIINATGSNHAIISSESFTTGFSWDGKDPNEEIRFADVNVYYDFVETLGLQVKEGRSFSREFGEETNRLILNETAVKVMDLNNPIGKSVRLWGEDATIIGVVKDFHHQSLHEEIEPSFIRLTDKSHSTMLARIEVGQEQEVITRLQSFYNETNPGYSFKYTFLDTQFERQYKSEAIVATLATYFAGLAILISCLGLFGLVAFSAQQRQKEIGIRKVLGASIFNIIKMLSVDFTKMVLLSIVIALPISYYFAQNWLSGFAFSMDLQPWFFVAAGGGALLIAWLTMSFQTAKAALMNPIESLRNE